MRIHAGFTGVECARSRISCNSNHNGHNWCVQTSTRSSSVARGGNAYSERVANPVVSYEGEVGCCGVDGAKQCLVRGTASVHCLDPAGFEPATFRMQNGRATTAPWTPGCSRRPAYPYTNPFHFLPFTPHSTLRNISFISNCITVINTRRSIPLSIPCPLLRLRLQSFLCHQTVDVTPDLHLWHTSVSCPHKFLLF